jgi:6-phosphogluconolactonase
VARTSRASIFPGSRALHERERLAVAVRPPHLGTWRITMTPPALLDAETIVVAGTGARKEQAVAAALSAPLDVERWPAQLLRGAGDRVAWIIDRPAAARWRDAPPV